MFYIVYKITNKINNKYYIGMHKTNNLDDGYMGSGKLIKRAIQKYGIEKFSKEILHIFDNEIDMRNKEKKLVVLSEQSYNLCDGGKGGFGYINRNKLTSGIVSDNSKNNLKKGNNPWKSEPEHYAKIAVIRKEKYPDGVWKNRKHSEETKAKLRFSKNNGEKNSQFGTIWVTNGVTNKKIKQDMLDEYQNIGYYKGRKIGDI